MNVEAYTGSPAGRLVRVSQGKDAYHAFVPNPLPPSLAPNAEMLRVCSDASYALGQLAALGRSVPNPRLLVAPFMRREAVLSSRIEGTQAGIADLYALEADQLPLPGIAGGASRADTQEVLNYVHALEYGLERMKTLPVSTRLLREVHERLMHGVRGGAGRPGEFRDSQNYIGPRDSALRDAYFVPPPVPEMLQALDGLERYLHAERTDLPDLVRLALIHYQFEAIHPFVDGNGRLGRLLVSLLLVAWELMPSPLLYLSAYLEQNRQRYYELLRAVSERSAWNEWVVFFVQGVADQARDASARAQRLQDLQATWRRHLTQKRASIILLTLVDRLFTSPMLTVPQAQELLGVTYRSAKKCVDRLVEVGILRQVGDSSYGKAYAADEIVNVVGEQSKDTTYT